MAERACFACHNVFSDEACIAQSGMCDFNKEGHGVIRHQKLMGRLYMQFQMKMILALVLLNSSSPADLDQQETFCTSLLSFLNAMGIQVDLF